MFFSPQLILQFYRGALMIFFKENLCFSKVPGGPTFSKGGRGGGF